MAYKPEHYNSVSPYLVVDGAQQMIELLKKVFDAKPLRRYDGPDGTIMHAEVMIEDSVVMIGETPRRSSSTPMILHVYVKDVDATYKRAIAAGCQEIEAPKERDGDPDRRGSFRDFAGNSWSIGTQVATSD